MSSMDIRTQIESDLKDAMRAKDELRKNTLRMALSALKLAEIDKGSPLDEQAQMALLQKEIKSRQEAIADAEKAGRRDIIASARAEIAVLESYLPKQLTTQELEQLASQAIAETGATSPREMGQVMKLLVPRLQGRASSSDASQVVRRLLGA
jgi:uncharacterized protein YqeY